MCRSLVKSANTCFNRNGCTGLEHEGGTRSVPLLTSNGSFRNPVMSTVILLSLGSDFDFFGVSFWILMCCQRLSVIYFKLENKYSRLKRNSKRRHVKYAFYKSWSEVWNVVTCTLSGCCDTWRCKGKRDPSPNALLSSVFKLMTTELPVGDTCAR